MRVNKSIINGGLLILFICLVCLGYSQSVYADSSDVIDIKANSQEEVDLSSQNGQSAPLQGRAIMIDLNSEKLEYFEEQNLFVATGSAEMAIPEQNSKIEAQKITYDQLSQILIAEGDVKITKNGEVVNGNYAKIDLSKESALINEPNAVIKQVKITANAANVYPKNIELLKGKASIDNRDLKVLMTSNDYTSEEMEAIKQKRANPENNPNAANVDPAIHERTRYRIAAKEVIVDSRTNMNIIKVKNATVWFGNIKTVTLPYLEFSTNKQGRLETMLPEFGSNKELGTYFGPSHLFYMQNGATLKIAPLLSYGSEYGGDSSSGFGGGGIIRYTSGTNRTELGYTTTKDRFVIKGEQDLFTPNTKLVYGSNAYMHDGLWGNRRPKHIMEIVDERKLLSAFNFDLRTRLSAGYAEDYTSANYYETQSSSDYRKGIGSGYGTARFKFQANLINSEPIFSIRDDLLQFRLHSQFGAAMYGTGDTFGIIRGGPRFDSRIGPLKLSSTYFQGIYGGDTPFMFDRYMYGKSNWVMSGDVKLHNFVNVGTKRSLNLTRDNWQNRLLTENLFYAKVGPEDLKFVLGYDFVRQRSMFGIDLLLGAGKTDVDFEKMNVNDLKED